MFNSEKIRRLEARILALENQIGSKYAMLPGENYYMAWAGCSRMPLQNAVAGLMEHLGLEVHKQLATQHIRKVVPAAGISTKPSSPATPEQQARDMLERMDVEGAQSMTAGDVGELAQLIAESQSAPVKGPAR